MSGIAIRPVAIKPDAETKEGVKRLADAWQAKLEQGQDVEPPNPHA